MVGERRLGSHNRPPFAAGDAGAPDGHSESRGAHRDLRAAGLTGATRHRTDVRAAPFGLMRQRLEIVAAGALTLPRRDVLGCCMVALRQPVAWRNDTIPEDSDLPAEGTRLRFASIRQFHDRLAVRAASARGRRSTRAEGVTAQDQT